MLTVSDRIQIPSTTTHKDTGTKANTFYYFISKYSVRVPCVCPGLFVLWLGSITNFTVYSFPTNHVTLRYFLVEKKLGFTYICYNTRENTSTNES